MPKTKLQNVIFTAIMAIFMVYGMIVYNVALNTGGVHGGNFPAGSARAVHHGPHRLHSGVLCGG